MVDEMLLKIIFFIQCILIIVCLFTTPLSLLPTPSKSSPPPHSSNSTPLSLWKTNKQANNSKERTQETQTEEPVLKMLVGKQAILQYINYCSNNLKTGIV